MATESDIDAFVALLAAAQLPTAVPPTTTNFYAPGVPGAARRRANLRHYLATMRGVGPTAVLVGEAPGYRGCRLTGVPFTSERLLLDGVVGADGYTVASDLPTAEATATIVWQTISVLPRLPLLWNAYPFHPHQPGNPATNRAPRVPELLAGERYFRAVSALFDIRQVVAVGRKAEAALARWGVVCTAVRHPSHGGKRAFQAALREKLGS